MLLQMQMLFSTDWIQGYKKVNPLFVPKLLINLGAGHISMKYGFMVYMESTTVA
jgi:3-oxoacyl-[acyl-carrier-protein] synthase II